MKKRFCIKQMAAIALLVVMLVISIGTYTVSAAENVLTYSENEDILHIPVGNDEGEIGYATLDGIPQFGPDDFIVENGQVYILDACNSKIVMYSVDGEFCGEIVLEGCDQLIEFTYADGLFYVVDACDRLFVYSATGERLEVHDLPDGIWGCSISAINVNDGEVSIQVEMEDMYCLTTDESWELSVDSQDVVVTGTTISDNVAKSAEVQVAIGDSIISIDNQNRYMSLIGTDNNENVYMLVVEYVEYAGQTRFEVSVRKYSQRGDCVDYAIIDMEGWKVVPLDYVCLDEDGNIYLMNCYEDNITISEVTLGNADESKLDIYMAEMMNTATIASGENAGSAGVAATSAVVSVSRDTAIQRANGMCTLTWTVKDCHKNTMTDVTIPWQVREAATGETLVGIPYCWGGFNGYDGSTSFANMAVKEGYTAGNICDDGYYKSGTIGIDCSGMICSAYALTTKQGTSQLASFGTQIEYSALQQGDFLVKSGEHCVMYWYVSGTSVYFIEAYGADEVASPTIQRRCRVFSRDLVYYSVLEYVARTPW